LNSFKRQNSPFWGPPLCPGTWGLQVYMPLWTQRNVPSPQLLCNVVAWSG
jgi:hypothetical protein